MVLRDDDMKLSYDVKVGHRQVLSTSLAPRRAVFVGVIREDETYLSILAAIATARKNPDRTPPKTQTFSFWISSFVARWL